MYHGWMPGHERKFLFLEHEKEGPVTYLFARTPRNSVRETQPQEQKRTHWETLIQGQYTIGETERRMLRIAEHLLLDFSKTLQILTQGLGPDTWEYIDTR